MNPYIINVNHLHQLMLMRYIKTINDYENDSIKKINKLKFTIVMN